MARGTCVACPCRSFASNMYRPALCASCFHSIADHFQEWKASVDGNGKRCFRNVETGATILAVEAQLSLGGGRDDSHPEARLLAASSGGDLPQSGITSQNAAFWSTWVAALAPARQQPPPPAGVGATASGAPHGDDGSDDDEDDHAANIVVSPLQSLFVVAVPDAPTAVPAEALRTIDLTALIAATTQAPSLQSVGALSLRDQFSAFSASSSGQQATPALTSQGNDASENAAGPHGGVHDTGDAPPPGAQASPPTFAPLALKLRVEGVSRPSPSVASVQSSSLRVPRQPPLAGPAHAISAAPSPVLVDLSIHLSPVYGNPLLVDLSEFDPSLAAGLSGGTRSGAGVTIFPMRQPYEEDVAVARYLLLTPFTMMAVAAHPTKLGVGILKWERSLLSLRHLATQPLLQMATLGAAAAAGGRVSLRTPDGSSLLRASMTRTLFRRSTPTSAATAHEPGASGGGLPASTPTALIPPLHARGGVPSASPKDRGHGGGPAGGGTPPPAGAGSSGASGKGILGFFARRRTGSKGTSSADAGGLGPLLDGATEDAAAPGGGASCSSPRDQHATVVESPLAVLQALPSAAAASAPSLSTGSGAAATPLASNTLSTRGSHDTAGNELHQQQLQRRPSSPAAPQSPLAASTGLPHPEEPAVIIGLLASFAPETPDSITFLRTYRAGRRPAAREGWLVKRKRTAWREHAPLGSLAWKKRWFVLELTRLMYYSAPPATGGKLKGVVPLSGWVEVSRTGTDLDGAPAGASASSSGVIADATTRPHSFLVRTGSTFHVFQAGSSYDAEAWVQDIAINAQHLGASHDEPQCMLLPTAADANALADAIKQRRGFLVCSMSEGARQALGEATEVTMDVVTEIPSSEALHRQAAAAAAASQTAKATAASRNSGSRFLKFLRRSGGARGNQSAAAAVAGLRQPTSGVDLNAVVGGMTVGDALSIAEAAGGITDDFLSQLPPEMAATLLQYLEEQLLENQRHWTEEEAGAAATSGAPATAGGAAASVARGDAVGDAWYYIDDNDCVQGPYLAEQMQTWLRAGYFGPSTLARFAGRVARALDPSSIDSDGVPAAFLPLSALYTDPNNAFASEDHSWIDAYMHAMQYQSLVSTASQFVRDPAVLSRAVVTMKEADMPLDLGLLLDMCGVTQSDVAALGSTT